jgi:hypothetical protein
VADAKPFKSWECIYTHTKDRKLAPEIKSGIGSIKCDACGRIFAEHSADEFSACLERLGHQRQRK